MKYTSLNSIKSLLCYSWNNPALVERQEQVYETCIAISIDKHRIARHTGGNATHVLRARDERGIAARG